jgi:16S rRNA (cytosine1402-N4)-methyltransferase
MTGSDLSEEEAYHVPVLCKAVLEGLITDRSGTYVDGTVGGGGHATAILNALEPAGRLFGIDQDPDALAVCEQKFAGEDRFTLLEGNFSHMRAMLSEVGVNSVHGILLDLGVSSHQIDTARRGFSYRLDGPLDMRMDQSGDVTAATVVNTADQGELADVLRRLGEEPRSGKIVKAISNARPVKTTRELSDVISGVVPARDRVKTLSRVFQAVRILINDELSALERALADSVDLLVPGGRIAVISYHSLEDRRVKRFLRSGNLEGEVIRDVYGNTISPFRLVSRRAIVADHDESDANPRARSARLRIAERTESFQ